MALICHRFDTKGFAAFPRGCHQPESPDTQDFSALHHRIYHVAPFGTGVRCVPSASDRCASHSAVRAKLKISFKQLSTGSIPVTSTIAKPRKPLFYAVFGAFTFNKSCIADIAKNRRYLLFLIFWRCSQMLRTVDITCSFVLRKVCRRCPAIPYFA